MSEIKTFRQRLTEKLEAYSMSDKLEVNEIIGLMSDVEFEMSMELDLEIINKNVSKKEIESIEELDDLDFSEEN